ncbi:MAG: 30S ribosomal protein S17 [Candidatus Pacebacteria bacterium]|nr:30S ribosomal protein S17 [Candidatus Paceibacterota bacterium]
MKKQLQGTIVSDKMQKTVVVEVERMVVHPKYRKRYMVSKRYKADNHNQPCQVGDVVVIEESKPISKDKKWRVVSVQRSEVQEADQE